MAENQEWPPARIVLAYTVVALGAIAGLAYLIPKTIIAIGAATGLAVGGMAATAAPWAVPVASVGLGCTGVTLLVMILVKATREASKEPFEWTVPILGIGGGLILDVAKEYALNNTVLKLAFSAVIAFLVVVAGACYKKGGVLWRVVALLLILLPPALVLVQNLEASARTNLLDAVRLVPGATWLRLGGFVVTGCAVALLYHLNTCASRKAGKASNASA